MLLRFKGGSRNALAYPSLELWLEEIHVLVLPRNAVTLGFVVLLPHYSIFLSLMRFTALFTNFHLPPLLTAIPLTRPCYLRPLELK